MGRPKGSTVHSDTKIILALLYKSRRFSEFEWALVEEFGRSWRIPRKTLARRLKALRAKGWIVRIVLPKHGHHVEYQLNFSKADEMLKELPLPELRLTRSQIKFLNTVDAVIPLEEELPAIGKFPHERVLDIFLRLRSGEFVCPKCLKESEGEKGLNVLKGADGRFYCRNCGGEILLEECEELLEEIMEKALRKGIEAGFQDVRRLLDAIDRQLRKKRMVLLK